MGSGTSSAFAFFAFFPRKRFRLPSRVGPASPGASSSPSSGASSSGTSSAFFFFLPANFFSRLREFVIFFPMSLKDLDRSFLTSSSLTWPSICSATKCSAAGPSMRMSDFTVAAAWCTFDFFIAFAMLIVSSMARRCASSCWFARWDPNPSFGWPLDGSDASRFRTSTSNFSAFLRNRFSSAISRACSADFVASSSFSWRSASNSPSVFANFSLTASKSALTRAA
mmetsp:Transcript_17396/g.56710  ORF Transcript_17396/g.56710 Transcript_17396/m.56710 type:complete len:225 (-) Transcript_17396:744-1418(-)